MSYWAVFALECCRREVVAGRFRGDEKDLPTKAECPFGCPKLLYPSGRPKRVTLYFLRYEDEKNLTPELKATEWLIAKQSRK